MSHKPDEEEGVDLGDLADALGAGDELIPETVDEVRLAEQSLDEGSVDLPDSLAEFIPRGERPLRAEPSAREPEVTTRPKMGLVIPFFSAGAGFAVAAAVIFALLQPGALTKDPKIAGAGDEIEPDPPADKTITLTIENECEECCGGNACLSNNLKNFEEKKDRDAQREAKFLDCASGRQCIPCESDDGKNAYQIRVSALHKNPNWKMPKRKAGPGRMEICVLANDKPLGCRAADESPEDLLNWSSFPTSSTQNQLLGGIEVRLASPSWGTVATWKNSVRMSPETLCRGVAATLRDPRTKQAVGQVSLFFDDAYFVQLYRETSVKKLQEHLDRVEGSKEELSMYFTKEETFALVAGPMARKPAEALRWQLLDQGVKAKMIFGDELQGQPRPAE